MSEFELRELEPFQIPFIYKNMHNSIQMLTHNVILHNTRNCSLDKRAQSSKYSRSQLQRTPPPPPTPSYTRPCPQNQHRKTFTRWFGAQGGWGYWVLSKQLEATKKRGGGGKMDNSLKCLPAPPAPGPPRGGYGQHVHRKGYSPLITSTVERLVATH